MEYRKLGKTGLSISKMGFGGIPIMRVPEKEALEIVAKACDLGINFFDTARAYVDSESKIGKALKKKRNNVVLASKTMARTQEDMRNDIDKSLKFLDTDYIDLYQCHNVRTQEELEKILGPKGAMEALIAARKEGKIRHIGLTGHVVSMALDGLKTGAFETIQAPYNFIEQTAEEELFPYARKEDFGIIAMKPLAGGAYSRPELALRFLLCQEISTIIPGMDSLEQVIQNIELAEEKRELNNEELQYLANEAQAIGSQFCRRCDYCQPCPQGVYISRCFILQGYYERYKLPEWAKDQYKALAVRADACEECGICETRCPYSLPIREMLKKTHKLLS